MKENLEITPSFEVVMDNALQNLITFISSDSIKILFVGAGLSNPIYPGWDEFIKNLRELFFPEEIMNPLPASPLEKKEFIDRCIDHDKRKYEAYVKNIFCESKWYTRGAYQTLSKISFDVYINLNFDSMLENALVNEGVPLSISVYPNIKLSPKYGQKPFHYFHGKAILNPTQLVFGQKEFSAAYDNPSTSILKSASDALLSNDILFVGVDLTEDVMKKMLTWSKEFRDVHNLPTPKHIWLKNTIIPPAKKIDEAIEKLMSEENNLVKNFEKLDVKIIPYYKLDRLYSGLDELLNKLYSSVITLKEKSKWGEV